MSGVEQELVAGGFCWDPKPGKPMDWGNVKPVRRASLMTRIKRAVRKPYPSHTKESHKARRTAQRNRWLELGIVKPRNVEEMQIAARGRK